MLTPLDLLLAACKYVTYFIVTGIMYSQKCAINTGVQVGHLALTSGPSQCHAYSNEWRIDKHFWSQITPGVTVKLGSWPGLWCMLIFLHIFPIDFHAWRLRCEARLPLRKGLGYFNTPVKWDSTRHEYAKVELSQQSDWYPLTAARWAEWGRITDFYSEG